MKSIMKPKLCCVLQRCYRLDMRFVEGGRNLAVLSFFHISQIRTTRSASYNTSYAMP